MPNAVPLAHAAGGHALDRGGRVREEVAVDRRGADRERDPTAGGTTQQRGQALTIASGARLLDVCGCHDTSPIVSCWLPPDPGAEERCRSNVVDPDCKLSRGAMPERHIVNAAKNASGSGFIRKLTTIRRRSPPAGRVAASL